MSRVQVPLVFRIHRGGDFISEVTLSQPVIKIGKLASSHIRLEDDAVSRMHAVVEVSATGTASITDLGSSRGTHVNGQRISKVELRSGDRIDLGDTRIDVALLDPARQPAVPAPATRATTPRPAPSLYLPNHDNARVAPASPAIAAPVADPGARAPGVLGGSDEGRGARAVEIAAMMGDSVLGVKHVMNPRSGTITRFTQGLFAAGALMLIMAGVAFAIGVNNAEFNKTSRDAWIQSQRPVHEWRPRRISLGYDWMALGGLATGIVCLTMGLIRARNERQSPFFRIGDAPEVEFPTSEAPASAFPLVAPRGDDFVLHFTRDMQGEVAIAGQRTSLAELHAQGRARASTSVAGAFELPIAAQARIKVRTGQNAFLISSVARPRQHALPLFGSIESRVLAFAGGSAMVHLAILALLRLIPPDPTSLALGSGGAEARQLRATSKAMEDARQELDQPEDDDGQSGGTGAAMADASGKMGSKTSKRAAGRYDIERRSDTPSVSRDQAIKEALKGGILGAMQAHEGSMFASIAGVGTISSGFGEADINGGMIGDVAGEMHGGFGFAPSGFGPGGGGTSWGTIGTGRYGTIGHGDSTGEGYGSCAGKTPCAGQGRGMGRRAGVPTVSMGQALPVGDLDKNIIRRYVRRKLDRIKYCYEKQLLSKPGIAGTVMSDFQISPQGTVLSSKAAGVDDAVASCVAEVIATVSFPARPAGGLVQVRYPFTFRPTGA
jgi:hypothetical protein